jgi:hypothetical protein
MLWGYLLGALLIILLVVALGVLFAPLWARIYVWVKKLFKTQLQEGLDKLKEDEKEKKSE